MPSIGIGYGNFSSNRRLQQVFAGQSVSSRPPRHSEQLSLYFSQTLCGTFSNGILRPRISQHHGRVNIVHAVPLRRRCRTAPDSVTIRATVRAASVHPDIDTLRTVAYAALAAIFPGGERIPRQPLRQFPVYTTTASDAETPQIHFGCTGFE